MIIRGRFVGDAPHFAIRVRIGEVQGLVWFLVDTGASRTLLLDRDSKILRVPQRIFHPSRFAIVGIGGSVRTYSLPNAELTWASNEGAIIETLDLGLVQHDLDQMPPAEASRVLRLPSVLGRDLLNRYRLICDYRRGEVFLEQ